MSTQTQFCIRHTMFLCCSFILLCIYSPVHGNLDLALIQPWISSYGSFPWKHDWYLEVVNHRYVKNLIIAVLVSYLGLWIASFKFSSLRAQRGRYLYFFAVAVLSTIVIGLIKSQSDYACPWYMTTPTAHGFSWHFNNLNGHCFPGGHAATGFCLIVGYFIYHIQQPKRAYFYLVAGLVLGFGMGWAQMMRGAHFLSHNLWTGWIIWAFNLLIYMLSYRKFKTAVFEIENKTSK